MRKYIIFKAESMSAEGWESRILAHTGAVTDILHEYYDSSDSPLPDLGYRPYEFHRVEGFDDPQIPGGDTHYRTGDWEVVRVEEYPTATSSSNYDLIAICYCKYIPKPSSLIPMPKGSEQVKASAGSFA